MACDTERAGPGPRSWAEDLSTYRSARGSQSYNTVHEAGVPARFARTNYVPFLATRHPLFAYDDTGEDGQASVRVDAAVQAERCRRHGWGDTSLLQEEGYAGVPHPRGVPLGHAPGRGRAGSPRAADGRSGLFGVLQMTEAGAPDAWVGHPLADPAKGRRAAVPPPDPKGRRDLFDVLHARAPGVPSDDSWLGHALVDPARGKACAPGPEQTRGRRDLTDIFNMSVLSDPRRLELLKKGADKFGDAWCGNILIDPARGKAVPEPPAHAAAAHLHGATFTAPAAPHSDFARRHPRAVEPPVADSALKVVRGELTGPDWGPGGKKTFPDLPVPSRPDGRKDLYAHMTYRPLTAGEEGRCARAFDDGGVRGKRGLAVPGSADPAKGTDMLAWRPEVRLGQFVPHGGLAQEGRVRGSKLRATSGR